MTNAPPARLFRPGDGALPPALTGRVVQQRVLSRCLGDLVAGVAPPHNIVLLGPRGNGKTALLQWFRAACAERSVAVEALTPHRIASREALADVLTPRGGIARWLPRKVGVASLGSAEWRADGPVRHDLTRALIARCRKKPLAVLLDEAHTLPPDIGGDLLNASQQVRADAPFLLVLAGTPGLPDRLSAMDASFWSRLGEGLLPVGRLDDAAAREALVRPLADHHVAFDVDALDAVVEHSQRYPYFIQLWGDELWQRRAADGAARIAAAGRGGRRSRGRTEHHAAADAARITADYVAAVRRAVAASVANYYQIRYRELRAEGLLAAAVAVAPLFQASADANATEPELETALAGAVAGDEAARFAALAELNRLGFVWCPPGQTPPAAWSAGIPSLMTYVLEQAARR